MHTVISHEGNLDATNDELENIAAEAEEAFISNEGSSSEEIVSSEEVPFLEEETTDEELSADSSAKGIERALEDYVNSPQFWAYMNITLLLCLFVRTIPHDLICSTMKTSFGRMDKDPTIWRCITSSGRILLPLAGFMIEGMFRIGVFTIAWMYAYVCGAFRPLVILYYLIRTIIFTIRNENPFVVDDGQDDSTSRTILDSSDTDYYTSNYTER